jgi:hypothetical protein
MLTVWNEQYHISPMSHSKIYLTIMCTHKEEKIQKYESNWELAEHSWWADSLIHTALVVYKVDTDERKVDTDHKWKRVDTEHKDRYNALVWFEKKKIKFTSRRRGCWVLACRSIQWTCEIRPNPLYMRFANCIWGHSDRVLVSKYMENLYNHPRSVHFY